MNIIDRWIRDFADRQRIKSPTVTALKSINFIMVIQTFVVGLLMLGPEDLFLQPVSPPDEWWLAPAVAGFSLWEASFILGAALLTLATATLKGITFSHLFLAASWLVLGISWTIGGIIYAPSYLFGVGILAVFTGLWHIALAGVWRAEGV